MNENLTLNTSGHLIKFFILKKKNQIFFFKKKKRQNLGTKGWLGHPHGAKRVTETTPKLEPLLGAQGGGRNHPQWIPARPPQILSLFF